MIVFETGKPDAFVPPAPEEVERGRADRPRDQAEFEPII